MPIVHIDLIEGRTTEQKRKLVKDVTDAITDSLGVPANAVSIVLNDMKKENYAVAGVLKADK